MPPSSWLAPSLIALFLSACSVTAKAPPSALAESPATICDPNLDDGGRFQAANIEGVFIVRDAKTNCTRTTNAALADTAFLPHSTFKIPNAMIGLETGVLGDETHAFAWDGNARFVESWNRDQTLATALQVSCVWCFQEVARRVGEPRMRSWLQDIEYGNEQIDGGIDQFWLTGSLRISPREQIDFVRRSLEGKLPVRQSNIELVWRLLEIERNDEGAFYGKTGLGSQDGRVIGWLVGYVEQRGRIYEYATLVRGNSDTDEEFGRILPLRKPITRALLVEIGALDP